MLQSSEFCSIWVVVLKVAVVMNFHSHFEVVHLSFWTVFLHTNLPGLVVKATTIVGCGMTPIPHLIKSDDLQWDPFQAYFAVSPKTSVKRLYTFLVWMMCCVHVVDTARSWWEAGAGGGRVGSLFHISNLWPLACLFAGWRKITEGKGRGVSENGGRGGALWGCTWYLFATTSALPLSETHWHDWGPSTWCCSANNVAWLGSHEPGGEGFNSTASVNQRRWTCRDNNETGYRISCLHVEWKTKMVVPTDANWEKQMTDSQASQSWITLCQTRSA